jgi:predicted ATP-dependent serine protease
MDNGKVQIKTVPTGVPDLDIVLGGGLPEYSFNVIAGAPGSGKTTLVHQIVFENASSERPASISPYWANRRSKCCATSRIILFSTPAKLRRT